MGKFDPTIKWLRRQRKNAAQAVRDLRSGQKIEFEGADVTGQWISRYEPLIDRYGRLIEKYEQRDRETKLSENLKFKE
jgi:hypothetical protein